MTLLLTTIEAISRRLIGRLEVVSRQKEPQPWGGTMGSKEVDPNTTLQIAAQKQSLVLSVLGMVYHLPLQLTSEITKLVLAEIVEKLTVADLMDIYYTGTPTETGFGGGDRKSAYESLYLYVAGHGIPIPQLPNVPTSPGISVPQGVVLPGERVRVFPIAERVSRNYTVRGKLDRSTEISFTDELSNVTGFPQKYTTTRGLEDRG